ncbi:hypothetical protein PXH80_33690, partial [Mycolicibacterium smegmatis]|nr:hypothetical protein [Mycolicibacterium smegmatis]
YISFLSPKNPSAERLSASTPIRAQGVTTEFNTLFETITAISERVDLFADAHGAEFGGGTRPDGRGERLTGDHRCDDADVGKGR